LAGNITYFAPISLFRSILSFRAAKILLYMTLIRPIVSYGGEAWAMTKKDEQALLVFERKIFRRIYGPKYENGEWKSRTNRELEEMSKGKNIVIWIKWQRISWLGHLERMEEDRIARKIFTQEMEGTRRRGGPRKGWKEEVERDLQVLGVKGWRELVIDRENGRIFFDRPKPTVGCSANGRRRRRTRRRRRRRRRCTNFTNLFCYETLHVSDSSSGHRQEFIHCTLSNGICHTGL